MGHEDQFPPRRSNARCVIAASLAVFFTWVYPANLATSNWTEIPTNWHELRTAGNLGIWRAPG